MPGTWLVSGKVRILSIDFAASEPMQHRQGNIVFAPAASSKGFDFSQH
jgi:hypothetical protein